MRPVECQLVSRREASTHCRRNCGEAYDLPLAERSVSTPKTPLEKRAVRSSFELMSSTLRFMTWQLDRAVIAMPPHLEARAKADAERKRLKALSLVYDLLMDSQVRR